MENCPTYCRFSRWNCAVFGRHAPDLKGGTKRTDTRSVTPLAHDHAEERVTNECRRRLPVGAELVGTDTVSFRVWAPQRTEVALYATDGELEITALLQPE